MTVTLLPPEPTAPIAPTPAATRIDLLDTLRGFALFGILVVNLPFFANPIYEVSTPDYATSLPDRIAAWFVAFAFEAKFYVLFSFLFGYGLAVQLARADARGETFGPRYVRRLVGLLAFGLLHAVCLFVGDILITYVLLGGVLWFLRDWSPTRLLRFALGLLALAVLGWFVIGLLAGDGSPEAASELARLSEEARRNYLGTFWQAVGQRLRDLVLFYLFTPLFNWPTALAMFALGLAAGKVGVFADLDRHLPALRRALPWVLAFGVVGNLLYAWSSFAAADLALADGLLLIGAFAQSALAAPALTLAYVTLIALALHHARFARWLRPLRAAGRMSLSNYLGQAIVCGAIFNGWGLGWYDRVGALGCLILAVTIFAAQVVVSNWWLGHFRQGPDEWLLRSWTYLRRERLRA